jgi:hypothetical protein
LLVLSARTEEALVKTAGATISDKTANGFACGSMVDRAQVSAVTTNDHADAA